MGQIGPVFLATSVAIVALVLIMLSPAPMITKAAQMLIAGVLALVFLAAWLLMVNHPMSAILPQANAQSAAPSSGTRRPTAHPAARATTSTTNKIKQASTPTAHNEPASASVPTPTKHIEATPTPTATIPVSTPEPTGTPIAPTATIEPPTPTNAPTLTVTVRTFAAKIRASAQFGDNVVGYVHFGDQLVVLGSQGPWYLVQLGPSDSPQSTIPTRAGWIYYDIVSQPR